MENWCTWAKFFFAYSGVVVSHVLPVKIWLHAAKFYKSPIFPVFSQEKRPLHMVNQKPRHGQFLPLRKSLIGV
jgi:hypothetical protein